MLHDEVAAREEVVERVRGQLEQLETRSAADKAQAARLKKGFWIGMFGQRPTKVNESFATPRTTMAQRGTRSCGRTWRRANLIWSKASEKGGDFFVFFWVFVCVCVCMLLL